MSQVVTPDRVADALVRGIELAHRDYEKWSMDWLWMAPEYLLTVYAARELAKISDSSFLTLEHSARQALSDAGAKGRGRLKASIRENGRFDILIWRPDGTPRAPIELKCQVTRYRQIENDVDRVLSVARRSRGKSSISFGAIAFYTSEVDGKDFSASERVERYIDNITSEAEAFSGKSTKVISVSSKIYVQDESAWAATALVFKPRDA